MFGLASPVGVHYIFQVPELSMKSFAFLALLLLTVPAYACEGTLLDQDFRRLASTEQVNLCEAYAGKVLRLL